MKAALSLVALATSALGAHVQRGWEHGKGHGGGKEHEVEVTTEVIVTYTTVSKLFKFLFLFKDARANTRSADGLFFDFLTSDALAMER